MTNKIIEQLFRRALENNISALRFNFRGVGHSQGSYDEGRGEQDDLKLVLDYLKNEHDIHAGNIHLIGYSFGSYISAMVASSMGSVQKLSMIAPPTTFFSFPTFPINLEVDLYMPEKDELSDPQHAMKYFQSLKNPKNFISITQADHFFIGKTKQLTDLFLSRNL